ncbi:MAG: hypothetical protein WDN28_19970 [Chthoniobacter sp.]
MHVLAMHLDTLHWPSVAVAVGSLLLIKFWPRHGGAGFRGRSSP